MRWAALAAGEDRAARTPNHRVGKLHEGVPAGAARWQGLQAGGALPTMDLWTCPREAEDRLAWR
jgi:hypothetical protein